MTRKPGKGGRAKARPPRAIPKEEFLKRVRQKIRDPRVPPKIYKVSFKHPQRRRWEEYRSNLGYNEAFLLAARVRYLIGPREFGQQLETKVEPQAEA